MVELCLFSKLLTHYEKCNLIVASRTNENLENLDVKHLKFDVLNDELDLNEIPEILDGFVYCPGSINLRPFRGLKINTFQDDLNINFLSMVKILQQVLNNLKKSECSSIVLYSTVAVKIGMPFHSSISASKGAIEGFAKSLAAEFAPDIRVNVIAPSLTDTPLASRFLNNDLKKEKVGHRHPLKRHGKAIDIANSTAFLLSEESSWLTGQILGVYGGMSTLNTSN